MQAVGTGSQRLISRLLQELVNSWEVFRACLLSQAITRHQTSSLLLNPWYLEVVLLYPLSLMNIYSLNPSPLERTFT